MESINIHLAKIEDLVSKIDDILDGARPVPFSAKVSVDRQSLFELIDELRPVIYEIQKDLPNEIMQAKRVLADSDKIINESRSKAAMIIKNAEVEVTKMTDVHEITKLAQTQAMQIVEEAKTRSKEYRIKSAEYADETLLEVEKIMRDKMESFMRNSREVESYFAETVDEIYENRQQLRGSKKQ